MQAQESNIIYNSNQNSISSSFNILRLPSKKDIQEKYINNELSTGEVYNLLELKIPLYEGYTQKHNIWIKSFEKYREYYEKNKTKDIPRNYKTKDGVNLYEWMHSNRTKYNNGELNKVHCAKLNKFNPEWNKAKRNSKNARVSTQDNINDMSYETAIYYLKDYYNEHGHLLIPPNYVNKNGICLGEFVRKCKNNFYLKGVANKSDFYNKVLELDEFFFLSYNKHKFKIYEKVFLEYLESMENPYPMDVNIKYKNLHIGKWLWNLLNKNARAKNHIYGYHIEEYEKQFLKKVHMYVVDRHTIFKDADKYKRK